MKIKPILSFLIKLKFPAAFAAGFVFCAAIPELKNVLQPTIPLKDLLAIIIPIVLLQTSFLPALESIRRFEEDGLPPRQITLPLLRGMFVILLFNAIMRSSLGEMTGYGALAIAGGMALLLFNLEKVMDRVAGLFIKPYRSRSVASSVRLPPIPEPCSGCRFYNDSRHLSCAVNPCGPANGRCGEFERR